MKLLVITPWFPTPNDPIDGSFIAAQTAALARRGHEVTLRVVKPWPVWPTTALSRKWRAAAEVPAEWEAAGLPARLIRYVSVPRYLAYGGEGRRMARALRARLPAGSWDAILAHTELVGEGALRGLAGKEFRTAVVVHGINTAPGMFATRKRRENLAWTLRTAARIVIVGPRLQPVVESWGAPAASVRVVPNGFDPALVERSSGRRSQPEPGVLRILSVSNLVPGKGIDTNLRALAIARESGLRVLYTVVGDGRETETLTALARDLEVDDATSFLGRLAPERAHEEMAACDVFSLPSSPEAFGVVYAEAMAHGKPIVGCIGEGAGFVCRDGEEGILVPPRDHHAVAAAWRRLAEQEVRVAMGERARARAYSELTWDRSAARLEAVLSEMVAK